MTPGLLDPLRHAILGAMTSPDPALRALAIRRCEAISELVSLMPPRARVFLEGQISRMQPSDWPLWVEDCRARRHRTASRRRVLPQCEVEPGSAAQTLQ
jgi:hypothetical protein